MSEQDELAQLIANEMPGRDGLPKVQDVWLASSILESDWLRARDGRMAAAALLLVAHEEMEGNGATLAFERLLSRAAEYQKDA